MGTRPLSPPPELQARSSLTQRAKKPHLCPGMRSLPSCSPQLSQPKPSPAHCRPPSCGGVSSSPGRCQRPGAPSARPAVPSGVQQCPAVPQLCPAVPVPLRLLPVPRRPLRALSGDPRVPHSAVHLRVEQRDGGNRSPGPGRGQGSSTLPLTAHPQQPGQSSTGQDPPRLQPSPAQLQLLRIPVLHPDFPACSSWDHSQTSPCCPSVSIWSPVSPHLLCALQSHGPALGEPRLTHGKLTHGNPTALARAGLSQMLLMLQVQPLLHGRKYRADTTICKPGTGTDTGTSRQLKLRAPGESRTGRRITPSLHPKAEGDAAPTAREL